MYNHCIYAYIASQCSQFMHYYLAMYNAHIESKFKLREATTLQRAQNFEKAYSKMLKIFTSDSKLHLLASYSINSECLFQRGMNTYLNSSS